jgi:sigma-E factor negative regulatory protein RseA
MKPMTTAPQTLDLLSALADNHSTAAECRIVLDACKHDPTLTDRWNTYHLVGDVLRSSAPGLSQGADLAFVGRLRQLIASEALFPVEIVASSLAPRLQSLEQGMAAAKPEIPIRNLDAANDGSFRWKIVAGVASVAAVLAIAWSTFGSLSRNDAPQLAQGLSNEQVLVASPIGPMLRDARLEELMADHRQLGSAATLQMPSGFFRNAAFDTTKNEGR